ncbi:MAG: hypothetical protein IH624_03535 [Phycisphaerae bacterium]|nr:hypothetical protein [Phycisphaerae bacterium]
MTISFTCPHCGNLCAFADRHAGRRARCTKCQGRFIIPDRDGGQAEKVREANAETPMAGFYHAVFVDTWPLFVRPDNVVSLVFLAAVVCFRFFLGHLNYTVVLPGFALNVPTDWIVQIVCWGCLFWFYMALVETTATGRNELPDIDIGQGLEFIWTVIKSVYLFFVAAVLAEIPFLILVEVLRGCFGWALGVWSHMLVLAGLFVFPMTLLMICCADEMWMVFRPDYIVVPICRALRPYFVVAALAGAAGLIQAAARQYGQLVDAHAVSTAVFLALNLVAVAAGILAMRAIGLFLRHHSAYFGWV